jgi:hypothetical protein
MFFVDVSAKISIYIPVYAGYIEPIIIFSITV